MTTTIILRKKVKMEIDIVVSSQTTATAPLPSTKWIVQIS